MQKKKTNNIIHLLLCQVLADFHILSFLDSVRNDMTTSFSRCVICTLGSSRELSETVGHQCAEACTKRATKN